MHALHSAKYRPSPWAHVSADVAGSRPSAAVKCKCDMPDVFLVDYWASKASHEACSKTARDIPGSQKWPRAELRHLRVIPSGELNRRREFCEKE